uniref:Uncharacterized protein n=2 Tax=Globodera rostochiensis TaxID=31243 RepID=A0A914GPW8_GLORO
MINNSGVCVPMRAAPLGSSVGGRYVRVPDWYKLAQRRLCHQNDRSTKFRLECALGVPHTSGINGTCQYPATGNISTVVNDPDKFCVVLRNSCTSSSSRSAGWSGTLTIAKATVRPVHGRRTHKHSSGTGSKRLRTRPPHSVPKWVIRCNTWSSWTETAAQRLRQHNGTPRVLRIRQLPFCAEYTCGERHWMEAAATQCRRQKLTDFAIEVMDQMNREQLADICRQSAVHISSALYHHIPEESFVYHLGVQTPALLFVSRAFLRRLGTCAFIMGLPPMSLPDDLTNVATNLAHARAAVNAWCDNLDVNEVALRKLCVVMNVLTHAITDDYPPPFLIFVPFCRGLVGVLLCVLLEAAVGCARCCVACGGNAHAVGTPFCRLRGCSTTPQATTTTMTSATKFVLEMPPKLLSAQLLHGTF